MELLESKLLNQMINLNGWNSYYQFLKIFFQRTFQNLESIDAAQKNGGETFF